MSALLRGIGPITCAFYLGMFLYLAVWHVLFPGFLEPMEGDVLQHIARIVQGQPIYPAPSAEYIPLAYMPGYFYCAAPFYWWAGDSFVGPRLLSSLAVLLSGGLVGWLTWRLTTDRAHALLSAGLFFASYRIMDASWTCALPDSLFLFWTMLGLSFWLLGKKRWHDFAWLVCFTLAFWTKQQGAFFFGFAVLYALLYRENAWPRWVYLVGMLVGGPGAYLLLGPFLGDHFFYFTFGMPSRWDARLQFSVTRHLFVFACFVPVSALLTAVYVLRAGWSDQSSALSWLRRPPAPLTWFILTTLASTLYTVRASGASNNHFIPLFSALCISTVLGFRSVAQEGSHPLLGVGLKLATIASGLITYLFWKRLGGHPIPLHAPVVCGLATLCFVLLQGWRQEPSPALGFALLVAQFAVSTYSPAHYLPERQFPAQLALFRQKLDSLSGRVLWIDYGKVPSAFSRQPLRTGPSWVALQDVARQQNMPVDARAEWEQLRTQLLGTEPIYLLSNYDLLWGVYPADAEKAKDNKFLDMLPAGTLTEQVVEVKPEFGQEFSTLRQLAPHWFGAEAHPRYLYRYTPRE